MLALAACTPPPWERKQLSEAECGSYSKALAATRPSNNGSQPTPGMKLAENGIELTPLVMSRG